MTNLIKTKIEETKKGAKNGLKLTLLVFGIPLILGVCNNYFIGFQDARSIDTTKHIIEKVETKKEMAEVTSANTIKAEVKKANYADCMNVLDLADRQFCLTEALKLKQ